MHFLSTPSHTTYVATPPSLAKVMSKRGWLTGLLVAGLWLAIFAGGVFTTIGAQARNQIARIDATTGSADSCVVRSYLVRVNSDGSLDFPFNSGTGPDNSLNTIIVQPDGKIIISGNFSNYDGTPRRGIARLNSNGTLDPTFDPGTGANNGSNVSTAILQPDGKIIIGGDFTSYNGVSRNRIARLNADGTLDHGFDPGTGADGSVHAAAVQLDGRVIIGGNFFNYNGASRRQIARLNSDGTLDVTFNQGTGTDGEVMTIIPQPDNKIIIGGFFTTYDGTTRNRIARLNSDGTLDSEWQIQARVTNSDPYPGANDTVRVATLQSDGKIVIGGDFTSYNGTSRNRIARLNVDGTLDTTFDPGTGTNSIVSKIEMVQAGRVTNFNTAPVTNSQSVATNEDTALSITLMGSDTDDDNLTFSIIQQPGHGSLSAVSTPDCTQVNNCTATLTYTPGANYNGPDSFTFKVNDGELDSATVGTVSITVNPVNDPPSFTKGANQVVNEDAGSQSIEEWATSVSMGGPADEEGQDATFLVQGNTSPTLFSAGPAINGKGTLTYTPAPNAFGIATVTVQLQDHGGTANGGVDTSATQTFTITVTPVNDVPSFTKGPNQSADDSGAQSVANWATSISPGPNESGQTLTFLAQNNSNPALFSVAPAISSTGTLSYTPAGNANGSATITIALMDNGGGTDTSPSQTFVITVTEVNDAPDSLNDSLTSVAEDSAMRTIPIASLLTNDTNGPNDVGQTLTLTGVGSPVDGTVTFDATNVYFTPTANFNGPASFQYTITDNGTTNGVADAKSDTATVSFTVTEVNDAPTAVNDPLGNMEEDAAQRTIPFSVLTGNDSKGPANESGQTLIVKTVSNPIGLTVSIVAGTVRFTPLPNHSGPASFKYTIQDNGTTNGVSDPKTSAQALVHFNITAVADTPSATNATTNANTQTTSGLVISRNSADGAEVSHFKITGITGGSLFKNDGTTPINNGDFITFAEGNAGLMFTPGTTNGSFTVQASTSASDAGLGGGTATATITLNALGGIVRFSSGNYSVAEGAGFKAITVERRGDTSQAIAVDYASSDHSTPAAIVPCNSLGDGFASSRCDFTTAIGTLRFAAGETTKTFNVLITQDNTVEGPEALDLTLSNLTNGAVFGVPQTATLEITDDVAEPATNPIDNASDFVIQQYHDVLNREPDAAGLTFWTDNIEKCNDPARRQLIAQTRQTLAECIDKQRESTAIAFFMSPEFQMTGGFVYHLHKGSLTGAPNSEGGSAGRLPNSLEFMSDMSQVSEGIVVNNQISGAVVESNRSALAAEFVQRPEFVAKYGGLNNTLYVQELFNTTGIRPTAAEKQALIDGLTNGTETKASVLRKVVDGTAVTSEGNVQFTTAYGEAFINQENRRLFVYLGYVGYLRRNPDAAGSVFWLGKLNQYNGDPFQAEMVRSFIVSPEYRSRFGQP